jgi:hypothetical protein
MVKHPRSQALVVSSASDCEVAELLAPLDYFGCNRFAQRFV